MRYFSENLYLSAINGSRQIAPIASRKYYMINGYNSPDMVFDEFDIRTIQPTQKR